MGTTNKAWPQEHSDELVRLLQLSELSFAEIAEQMNADLGTNYSRDAVLGRAWRMNHCKARPPVSPEMQAQRKQARITRGAAKRKAERWAAKPWLANRAECATEKKRIRAQFAASGTPKTSRAYRMHLPKIPEMTKTELRAMLTNAVQNTAAMEVVQ